MKHIATLEKIRSDLRDIKNEEIREWHNLPERKQEAYAKIMSEDMDHLAGAEEEIYGAILLLAHFRMLDE